MLRSSSACGYDKPLSYAAILDGSMPGWLDTNNEEKPWAEVQLAGDSDVSGIVLLNRYEYAADQEEFKWAAPLKVSVSTDGKAYTEVARVEQPEALFRIDLQGKAARARFVRIERAAPADGSKPGNGRWHFRSFLVYGKKLY
ncbi:MAG: discoidin domain-containing protein [Kiritimatiellia bacterium]